MQTEICNKEICNLMLNVNMGGFTTLYSKYVYVFAQIDVREGGHNAKPASIVLCYLRLLMTTEA